MSTISQEENQRIAAEFATFQKSHPEFIFTQRNIGLIGEELERLNAVEMQFNRPFDITAATLEIAATNLIKTRKIEAAALPKGVENETPVSTPTQTPADFNNPHLDNFGRTAVSAVEAQKNTKYWEDRRKAAADADLASRKKAAEELFSRGSRTNQEEKTERIPDSVMECEPAEESRILQLYSGPEIRKYLERKRMLGR